MIDPFIETIRLKLREVLREAHVTDKDILIRYGTGMKRVLYDGYAVKNPRKAGVSITKMLAILRELGYETRIVIELR